MSLGTLGSTLNDELNRLANGGTYRDSGAMVDEALAAKQWANRENISPYSTDTVGVLNEIAGLGTNRQNWLDFNGVCNYIAGTSGLPAAAALRQIYPTTDLLTGVASYYIDATDASASGQTITNLGAAGSLLPTTVGSSTAADSNDPKFLDHTGTNYVYLPGAGGTVNNLSVPDATALDITGDIDLRAYVALDDWTPAANQYILSKFQTTTTLSYILVVTSSGNLLFGYSTDGTLGTFASVSSSVATGFTDGTANWIRATRNSSTGSVIFYTSSNGTTWTQLGTTQSTTPASMYSGSSAVEIGTASGSVSFALIGKTYRAQIYSDITETTKVLDVDTSVITTGAATSFTAVTGQTVTINRATSGRKTVAVTQPTWLFGTDDYMEVNNRYMAHSTAAENYVYLSGASGNNMTVSDTPPLSVTGDIDLRAQVALDDWSSVTNQSMLGKWSGGNRSYSLLVNSDSTLTFRWSANGSTLITKTSTVALSIADGAIKWVRATLDVDNGASGNDVKFFSSDNGTTWTQLGATVTTSGVTSIFDGGGNLEIGTADGGTSVLSKGKFYRAQVLNGIDGTVVFDADASVITLPSQTTFVDRSSNAYTVTINKSGVGTFVSTGNYMYLPGIASNYASAPDSAALDITGDIDLRVKVALDDWTPGALTALITKWNASQYAYYFGLSAANQLQLYWSANGTSIVNTSGVISTVLPTVADGATLWVRVTLDVDNGASGNTTTFFTSPDGITWTQLGSAVTLSGTTSIFAGTASLFVGVGETGAQPARGKFFRAQVLNGIGGTVAFDANFENSITSLTQASFTESSTNGATVTINRSGSTFRSAGVIDAGYLYPGATNTFSNSTISYLDFGATQSLTVFGVFRQWATQSNGRIVDKRSSSAYSSGQVGYSLNNDGATQVTAFLGDGVDISFGPYYKNISLGSIALYALSVNRDTNKATAYYNNSPSTTGDIPLIGDLTNVFPLSIGRWSGQAGNYADMEFIGAAVFRQALTATQIRQITNYFANREAYL